MKFVGIAFLGCVGLIACSSANPSTGSNGNPSGEGNTGNFGGSGNTGNSGGSGNTGNFGGVGNTGNSGGVGNTGNSGGIGNTGNFGGAGNVGNTGNSGGSADTGGTTNVGGSGDTGNTGGAGNTGGSATGGTTAAGGSPNEPPVVAGCGSAQIYQADADPGKPGPWPVGVKTVKVSITGGTIPVEVWYPATYGSDAGKTPASYDLTAWLGASSAALIPASANAPAVCDFTKLGEGKCYRDLPIDTNHGPYPVVIFIHGTGSFRVASMSTMVAWASHGFIVLAADHPGLFLSDFLGTGCGASTGIAQDLSRDVDAEIAAVNGKVGDLSFLGTAADTSRYAISGHSQGASNAATFASKPNMMVDMPFADLGGTAAAGSALKAVLLAGGASDSVVPYSSDQGAYTSSVAAQKYLVGITAGNHLDVTDLCWQTNSSGQTAIAVANKYLTCSATLPILDALAQCGTMPDPTKGPAIVNYTSTAVLEQTLNCVDRTAAFNNLKTEFPQVSDFEHTP
jgi:predicted dienelactone hydrolase